MLSDVLALLQLIIPTSFAFMMPANDGPTKHEIVSKMAVRNFVIFFLLLIFNDHILATSLLIAI